MKTDDMPHHTHTDKFLLPNTVLFKEVEKMLSNGQSVMLKATGNSMLPFIVGGRDSVLIQQTSGINPLQVRQIVLAHLPDSRYVLHRIVRICETEVILMGDGNFRETESCRLSDIMGVVTKISRNGCYVDCNARAERYKAEIWGRLLPIRRYLLYIYKRIWI
ncbi:S24/S26 family peptidase [Bacteroides sp.]|uniref:S24/S26 family peptidase n=1 Tax=Bacteroides sp. TaxID=29523 RepID=UPI002624D413|nr:S24/S26 family peptidase [Bacteroides sp.]